TLASKYGIDEKQVIGWASLPTKDEREKAIDARLSGTKHDVQLVRFLSMDMLKGSAKSSETMKKMMEKFVAVQGAVHRELQTIETSFNDEKSKDENFVDQIEKLALRTKGDQVTLEQGRAVAEPDSLKKG